MNAVQVFENTQFGKVRIVVIDGEPWLVGKDVAAALGYANPRDALAKHVDDEDKGASRIATPSGEQDMTVINESGLYSLVMSSKLPGAKQFRRWVTSEVLPSIRKHGAYMTPETLEKALLNPDTLILLAQRLKAEQERSAALEAKVNADRPKVLFAESVAASDQTILIAELAKILKQNGVKNMGQNRLFAWLRENGYLIRRKGSDYNMPTQRAMELGLFRVKETAITHSDGHVTVSKTAKATGKGQEYFINLFLAENEEKSLAG